MDSRTEERDKLSRQAQDSMGNERKSPPPLFRAESVGQHNSQRHAWRRRFGTVLATMYLHAQGHPSQRGESHHVIAWTCERGNCVQDHARENRRRRLLESG